MLRSKILSDISAQIQTASHDHKPHETVRDEEETEEKLLLPSFFFSFQLFLLQESLFRWPIVDVALKSYLVSTKH